MNMFFRISMAIAALVVTTNAIAPTIYEQDDFGDPRLNEFIYWLAADCENKTITVGVLNESYDRLVGTVTYLKYIDYSTPLLSREETNAMGRAIHVLPGEVNLMRGQFIAVIEGKGYRTKEIHFDISGCHRNQTVITPPEQEKTNQTIDNKTVEEKVEETPEPAENNSVNKTSEKKSEEPTEEMPCAAVFLLPFLLLFKIKQVL